MTNHLIAFWVLAAAAVGSALAVVAQRNPVRSALFLVGHMLILAALFLTLSAQFVAAVQVIVYAGAIMVLVLFTIMLLNLGAGGGDRRRRGASYVTAAILAMALALTMTAGAVWRSGLHAAGATAKSVSSGGAVETIGYALYDPELQWLFPFELTSILLLTAVVGAVVLARRRT